LGLEHSVVYGGIQFRILLDMNSVGTGLIYLCIGLFLE